MIAPIPPTATPAPIRPPIIALLLESGSPARVAPKIRSIADPMPTMIDAGVRALFVTIAVPMVACNCRGEDERAQHVADRGEEDRFCGRECPGGDNGCDGVRGIVEAVDERKTECKDDPEEDKRFHDG